jgi:hypothetical protein
MTHGIDGEAKALGKAVLAETGQDDFIIEQRPFSCGRSFLDADK